MVRTKKADPVEVTHNVESCVCSDCKIHKLELEVIDLKARYADERAHYQAQLANARTEIERTAARMEARINLDWRTEHVTLSKRVALLEAEATKPTGLASMANAQTDIIRRLRTLEANRPVEIRDRDVAHISRDIKLVTAKLDRIVDRLDPPSGLPF